MDVSRSSNTFRMQLISVKKRERGTNGEENGQRRLFRRNSRESPTRPSRGASSTRTSSSSTVVAVFPSIKQKRTTCMSAAYRWRIPRSRSRSLLFALRTSSWRTIANRTASSAISFARWLCISRRKSACASISLTVRCTTSSVCAKPLMASSAFVRFFHLAIASRAKPGLRKVRQSRLRPRFLR